MLSGNRVFRILLRKFNQKSVYMILAPPLFFNTILRILAGFGVFMGRKCDGEPGPQTILDRPAVKPGFCFSLENSRGDDTQGYLCITMCVIGAYT